MDQSVVQKLHGNERLPMLIVNFVNRADIGMIQRGCGFSLALEAAQGLGILRYIIGKELEGNKAAEFNILGFVDNPHPTPTQLFDNAVVGDILADHSGRLFGPLHLTKKVFSSQRQIVAEQFPDKRGLEPLTSAWSATLTLGLFQAYPSFVRH